MEYIVSVPLGTIAEDAHGLLLCLSWRVAIGWWIFASHRNRVRGTEVVIRSQACQATGAEQILFQREFPLFKWNCPCCISEGDRLQKHQHFLPAKSPSACGEARRKLLSSKIHCTSVIPGTDLSLRWEHRENQLRPKGCVEQRAASGERCGVKDLFDKFSLRLYSQVIPEQALKGLDAQSWSNRICQTLGSLDSVLEPFVLENTQIILQGNFAWRRLMGKAGFPRRCQCGARPALKYFCCCSPEWVNKMPQGEHKPF